MGAVSDKTMLSALDKTKGRRTPEPQPSAQLRAIDRSGSMHVLCHENEKRFGWKDEIRKR
jgi:hypothetical protein